MSLACPRTNSHPSAHLCIPREQSR
jgi:hypothetical protein